MSKFQRWTGKEGRTRLQKLKNSPLFNDLLLPDIKKGIVFPAIRKGKIDFYHLGRKLFSFSGTTFRSNISFVVAFQGKPKGEVSEASLKKLSICPSFYDGYEQIKANTKLYVDPESLQVSKLCKQHSCFASTAKSIVVLDIELSMASQAKRKTADRMDLIMLNLESGQLRFFEVKTFKNQELKPVRGHAEVMDQIKRYEKQIEHSHLQLLKDYGVYTSLLKDLFGLNLKAPKSIDPKVDLLIFDYTSAQEKTINEKLIPIYSKLFTTSSRGSADGVSLGALKKWWRNGR